MKGLSLSLRKGAWSKVEDDLLKACVRQYGEGKWHLVPTRAGLNRSRKSCRLRWLNYLKPSIKRGKFSEDEVDMMKRLHRLLGNRWSLIAGRLPGRTSNDVKNYWNTHIINKKLSSHKEKIKNAKAKEIIKPNLVIKPQPWTFTTTTIPPPWLKMMFLRDDQNGAKQCPTQSCAPLINGHCINVMEDKVGNILENGECYLGVQDGMFIKDFNDDGGEVDCLLEDESWNGFLDDFNLGIRELKCIKM